MAFLEARGIAKSYTVGGTPLTVLRDLDLDGRGRRDGRDRRRVGRRQEHAAARPRRPRSRSDAGTVAIAGIELTTLPDAELVAFRNRQVGFVFQFHHLLPEFSAVENAEMPMRIARLPRRGRARRAPRNCCGASASASG